MLEKEVYPGFLKNDTKNLIKQDASDRQARM